MRQVNWGIIGLGKMATKFAESFKNIKNSKLKAVASRDTFKLKKFKNSFDLNREHCFSNYEDILDCKDLDIIYIALPHSLHSEWSIKCIEKNKNILVEKPATVNFSEMEIIEEKLKKRNIFFAEAFMYRYHPQIIKLVDLIKEGAIGKLISMESFFGNDILSKKIFGIKFKKRIKQNSRLHNKELGGGAILDLGCYPVSISILVASLTSSLDISKTKVLNKKVEIGSTGVDINAFAELHFENGFKSTIHTSFKENLEKSTKIIGTDGELVLKDGWHGTPSLINIAGKINRSIQVECNENVYTYQIEAVSKNILENKKKPNFPGVTSSESLENMRILDNWLN